MQRISTSYRQFYTTYSYIRYIYFIIARSNTYALDDSEIAFAIMESGGGKINAVTVKTKKDYILIADKSYNVQLYRGHVVLVSPCINKRQLLGIITKVR